LFSAHPSHALNKLFADKPYQGVAPDQAEFLFIGLDANYAPDIHLKPIFQRILEYHADGVAFWRKYGVHHPFLLPEYSGDGQFYHRSFARIGFGPQHADLVSFVELLHVPTVGKSALVAADLDASHLRALDFAILSGRATHIFVPSTVARLMAVTKVFPWLPKVPIEGAGALRILYRSGVKTVYSHLHFSAYGKFESLKRDEAAAIRGLLPQSS
jgi:hypothetical protein